MTSRAEIAAGKLATAILDIQNASDPEQLAQLDIMVQTREALEALLRQHGYFDPARRRVGYSREEKEMELKSTIATPWDAINQAIGGFAGGDTILLPAPLGGSKSATIHAIAGAHLRLGHPTTVVELEMGSVHTLIGVARNVLQADFVPEIGDDLDRLVAKLGGPEFERLYAYLDHGRSRRLNIEDVIAFVDEQAPETKVLLIDYIDRITTKDREKGMPLWEEQEVIFSKLQEWLWRTGRIAYTALQFNREGIAAAARKQKRDHSMIGGAITRVQYAPYIAEVVMDRAKMETRLRWGKSRLPFPHFDAVYEYVPCAPALRNPRGYLRLKETVDHASVLKDADAARQTETDRLNRELVAIQTHLEAWAKTGAPPPLFTAGREVPLRIFPVEEGEGADQRAVVASEFEAAWKAASAAEPEVFDRAWKMLRKNGGLLLHGFDVRRMKVRAASARSEQNYIVWRQRATA
jgi:hypothetical protein